MSTIDVSKLEKLSVAERQAIKEQISAREEQLSNIDKLHASGQNGTAEMKEDIVKKKEILARDEALIANGPTKDRIVARMKEIERIIVPAMPSKEEMWHKLGTDESNRAIQKNVRFHAKYSALCREWQILAKRLEPDDPWAQNLDSIRQDKISGGV
jgi:hypothetical protein